MARHDEGATGGARVRLLAIDLDGTLLRGDGSISLRTRAALDAAEAAGVAVLTVTARPPRRVRLIAEAVGLRGLAVCSNGGVVYDLARNTVIRQAALETDVAEELVTRLRVALPGVAFAVEAGLRYGREPSYAVQAGHADDAVDASMLMEDALALCRLGVTKLIVQHPDYAIEELLKATADCAGVRATVTYSGAQFVEVAASGVTKALAVAAYCEEAGISRESVVAFGDMPNDLPLLQWAGHGVAVANAHAEVLACADEVTASNDEDGVAAVLERLAKRDYVL